MGLVCFGLLILLIRKWKVIISKSWSLQCLLLENFVFWQCSLLIGSTFARECNQSDCGVVHLGYAKSIFWMISDNETWKIVKSGELQKSESSLISVVIAEGSADALHNKNVLLRCLMSGILLLVISIFYFVLATVLYTRPKRR